MEESTLSLLEVETVKINRGNPHEIPFEIMNMKLILLKMSYMNDLNVSEVNVR